MISAVEGDTHWQGTTQSHVNRGYASAETRMKNQYRQIKMLPLNKGDATAAAIILRLRKLIQQTPQPGLRVNCLIATFVFLAAQSSRGSLLGPSSQFSNPSNIGVVLWGSATQRFEKRFSDQDGSTKSKNKAGRSGKDSSIAYNAVRFAGPRSKLKIQRPNECNGLWLLKNSPQKNAPSKTLC
jgi:hypothetical protein